MQILRAEFITPVSERLYGSVPISDPGSWHGFAGEHFPETLRFCLSLCVLGGESMEPIRVTMRMPWMVLRAARSSDV